MVARAGVASRPLGRFPALRALGLEGPTRSPAPRARITVEQLDSLGRCEEVVIPANYGFQRGTWFLIAEGVRGVLVPERPGGPVVYLLVEPASNYYRNMTGQSTLMPVFINQVT